MNAAELADYLAQTLFVTVEASGRHVHVTKEQAIRLFGHDLTEDRPLSQPGQYLSRERVTIRTGKGEFQNVAVLGPCRKEAQVEISRTDAVVLGLDPPIRLSGKTKDSPGILLLGSKGELTLPSGVIIAQRHIHMPPEEARRRNLTDGQQVRLRVPGKRPVTFERVIVRVDPSFAPAAHLDFDEANACALGKNALGLIVPN